MAVPEATFHFIGYLAVAAGAGTFFNLDRPTRVVLSLFSSVLWFIFAFSAYQVEVVNSTNQMYELLPLAYLGYGAGTVMAMFFLHHAFGVLKQTMSERNRDMSI